MTTYTQDQIGTLKSAISVATIELRAAWDLLAAPSTSQPLTKDQFESLVGDLAEWSSHVEVDTAPTTLTKHVEKVLAFHGIKGGA